MDCVENGNSNSNCRLQTANTGASSHALRMTTFLRVGEAGVDDAGEVEDGGPLAVALGLPDDFAVEESGGFGGAEVVVEVEVLCVGGLVVFAEVEAGGGSHLVEKIRAVSNSPGLAAACCIWSREKFSMGKTWRGGGCSRARGG